MRKPLFILLVLVAALVAIPASAQSNLPIDRITLPEGFEISVYASGLPNARMLALGDNGTVFVGTRQAGNVYALTDADGDGVAEQTRTLLRGLNSPNGVAFLDGALYVAEIGRILRYDDIEAQLDAPPQPLVVNGSLPNEPHHGWKTIHFGPDGALYIPSGAPCNVCETTGPYGVLMRLDLANPTNLDIVATGIRNTVGFDWHPESGELWFSDNARDDLGDNLPADELNRISEVGQHFGFPYCYDQNIPDPTFGGGCNATTMTAPAIALGPHVAPLGVRFYTGDSFPEAYQNQAFIAEHGSASRSQRIGYRVMMVTIEDGEALSYAPFAEGWLGADGSYWGRPVDVMVMPDGAMLVSDDYAGAVYRIAYTGA
jgi:glucose/arabinose dehydrogenase